jgi:hypothetical protein
MDELVKGIQIAKPVTLRLLMLGHNALGFTR